MLDESARALLPELRREGVPLAFVGTHDPAVECDRAVADNGRAGWLATEHLQRLGHRRIVFLGPTAEALGRNSALRGRREGYREAMRLGTGGAIEPRSEEWELLDPLPAGVPEIERGERLISFFERT